MRRLLVAAGAALVTGLVLGALGADASAELVAQRGGGARRSGTPARGAAQSQADVRSLLRGRVTGVDSTTGRVAIDVNGTVLEARYPPEMAADLRVGDAVFVDLTIMKTNGGAGSPRGEATLPGSASEVDAQKNTMTINTPKGALTVPIAPAAVDRIRPGDEVVLRLGLVDIGPAP